MSTEQPTQRLIGPKGLSVFKNKKEGVGWVAKEFQEHNFQARDFC